MKYLLCYHEAEAYLSKSATKLMEHYQHTYLILNSSSISKTVKHLSMILQGGQRRKSPIFKFFTPIDSLNLRCNICHQSGKQATFCIKLASYKATVTHLQKYHNINIKEHNIPTPQQRQQMRGQQFLFDLICHHKVPIKAFRECKFFELAYQTLGLVKPGPSNIIEHESTLYKVELVQQIVTRKNNYQMFGVACRIVTSRRETKYLAVSLRMQGGVQKNLGLIRVGIRGDVSRLLSRKLSQYEVSVGRDVIAICCEDRSLADSLLALDKPIFVCLGEELKKKVKSAISQVRGCQEENDYPIEQLLQERYREAVRLARGIIRVILRDSKLREELVEKLKGGRRKCWNLGGGEISGSWTEMYEIAQTYYQFSQSIQSTSSSISPELVLPRHHQDTLQELVHTLEPVYLCYTSIQSNESDLGKVQQYIQLTIEKLNSFSNPLAAALADHLIHLQFTHLQTPLCILARLLSQDQPEHHSVSLEIRNVLEAVINGNLQEEGVQRRQLDSSSANDEMAPKKLEQLLNKRVPPYLPPLNLKVAKLNHEQIDGVLKQVQRKETRHSIIRLVRRRLGCIPVSTHSVKSYVDSLSHLPRSRQPQPSWKVLEGVGLLSKHMDRLEKGPLS